MEKLNTAIIIQLIHSALPDIQAIYLFGSFADGSHHKDSDIDIAVLLPHLSAQQLDYLSFLSLQLDLEQQLQRRVDLINLRQVSTVLQKEVITTGNLLITYKQYASDEFEMLTLSFYQKLNAERKELLDEFWSTGKAYNV